MNNQLKHSARHAKIGDYLIPQRYREHFNNRAMEGNEGVYSLMSPFPGCGLKFNSFYFRLSKDSPTIIHTYLRGELIQIEQMDYKWNNQTKQHDTVVITVNKTKKDFNKCGNPKIFRLLRYLKATLGKNYVLMHECCQSVTLYKRPSKSDGKIFHLSKWTGKLLGKNNRE